MWEIDPRSDWQAQPRRLVSIVFTGLRAGHPVAG
jgi:hypothetical protein